MRIFSGAVFLLILAGVVVLVSLSQFVLLSPDGTFSKKLTLAACQDGIDNDGDSKVDYGSDVGCESPLDNDESNVVGPSSEGTSACPDGSILVGSESDFIQVYTNRQGTFCQTNDIDFQGHSVAQPGIFSGTYDGNGFHLKNIHSTQPYGLFDRVLGGTIRNIVIDNLVLGPIIYADPQATPFLQGGIAGTVGDGSILSSISLVNSLVYCSTPNGDTVGSIAGVLSASEVRSVHVRGFVGQLDPTTGYCNYIGGLFGKVHASAPGATPPTSEVVIVDSSFEGDILAPGRRTSTRANGDYVGGLVGYIFPPSPIAMPPSFNAVVLIQNSHATVNIDAGQYVGGLVGINQGGSVSNSWARGTIRASEAAVGGLVGFHHGASGLDSPNHYRVLNAPITNSFAEVVINWVRPSGTPLVYQGSGFGGLVGYNTGQIVRSYATGSIEGHHCVGGLVGTSGHSPECQLSIQVPGNRLSEDFFNIFIEDSYATGSVSGLTNVGGFIGVAGSFSSTSSSPPSRILRSYSSGSVTSSMIGGGFIATNRGLISSSFWDTTASGLTTSAGGAGKTTSEMQHQATFVDWDFANVWRINEGQDYPRLR